MITELKKKFHVMFQKSNDVHIECPYGSKQSYKQLPTLKIKRGRRCFTKSFTFVSNIFNCS